MLVEVGDLKSTVRAVDGDSLLSPQTMERIVRVVLQAVDDREFYRRRVNEEQRVATGINREVEQTELG